MNRSTKEEFDEFILTSKVHLTEANLEKDRVCGFPHLVWPVP